MMTLLKGVGAVLVGLVTGMVVVVALTFLATLIFFEGDRTASPTAPYLVLNIAYSFAAAILAGWLAARLAGTRPIVHAAGVALAMLILSAGSGGASGPAVGVPEWYGPTLTLLMPLGALIGGWLRARSLAPGVERR